MTLAATAPAPGLSERGSAVALRSSTIGLTAFFTLVDLFAAQAILPSLTKHYAVSPAAMGLTVNASTFGMAAAGLAVALFSRRIERRTGIVLSLLVLAVPTSLLAVAPDLTTFALLRVVQGLCMSAAFTLTLAYLGERCSAAATATAFAAYITGNVGSNLIGRLVSAAVADHFGLAANFYLFAALNLTGALLAFVTIRRSRPESSGASQRSPLAACMEHLRNPPVLAGFGVGFCILFAFIGTFTYVNFVLVRPPLSLGMMSVGFVYLVFLPSIVLTPLAGEIGRRVGTRPAMWLGLGVAGAGLPLLVTPNLVAVLAGMVLVGVGTFFAQAIATGFVSRAATGDRGAASGIYLASYFAGGLAGSAVLGQAFDRLGWPACVAGIGIALAVAALLVANFRLPQAGRSRLIPDCPPGGGRRLRAGPAASEIP
jgi:predicted MFS family arabinose efflux permease